MNSAYYTKRKGRLPLQEPAFFANLVCAWSPPDETSLSQTNPISNALRRNRRCFNQFDRKTDCFDPFVRARIHALQPTSPIREAGLGSSGERFKAVCSTQTRQGDSLNKNQSDSQNTLMVAVADGSKNKGMHTLGLRPLSATFKAFWQKPGIERPLFVKSSTQLGLAVREKALITRN